MKDLKPLQTITEYERALKEIEPYFKNVPVPGTKAADRFDVLSALIEMFEKTNYPMPDTD